MPSQKKPLQNPQRALNQPEISNSTILQKRFPPTSTPSVTRATVFLVAYAVSKADIIPLLPGSFSLIKAQAGFFGPL